MIAKKQNTDISESIKGILGLPEGYSVGVHLVRKKVFIPDFVMVFQEAVGKLFEKEIAASTFKILVLFLFKLQYSNHIGIDQKSIADITKLALPTVKKGIEELKRNFIIISYEDPQDKRRNVYLLNPVTAWKGSVQERGKALKHLDSNQLLLDLSTKK